DGGRHGGDIAHLRGQVVRHQVHVVGEVFPRARDALYIRLPAQFALGADLARHAGDLGGETVQLIDHDVDGIFQFEDLAFDIYGDLLGQVAFRHSGGDLGAVAHLACHVPCHLVPVVRLVVPLA